MLPVSRRKQAPGPEIVEQIGHRLASVYNSVLAQPIPDRFLDLLAQLEAGEKSGRAGREICERGEPVTGVPSNVAPQPRQASAQIKADLIAVIPNLRAFAVSLCGNPDRADDLVQETLVKAWGNLDLFVEGTNLPAWLFTILRNFYYSEYRKRRREVADPDGVIATKLATAPAQNGHMDLRDLHDALQQLPGDQREALILIGASGLSSRRSGKHLRLRDRHNEEPRQPRAQSPC